jgi:hypothetical protein
VGYRTEWSPFTIRPQEGLHAASMAASGFAQNFSASAKTDLSPNKSSMMPPS